MYLEESMSVSNLLCYSTERLDKVLRCIALYDCYILGMRVYECDGISVDFRVTHDFSRPEVGSRFCIDS